MKLAILAGGVLLIIGIASIVTAVVLSKKKKGEQPSPPEAGT